MSLGLLYSYMPKLYLAVQSPQSFFSSKTSMMAVMMALTGKCVPLCHAG